MAIRLRRIEGLGLVALCAARSVEKPGDIYLDDNAHHALGVKFHRDFESEGRIREKWQAHIEHCEPDVVAAIEQEESNNPARESWDREFGSPDR